MNLLIITGIFPPDIGGPATYIPAISTELVKRGHKITVLTLSETLDQDDTAYSFRVERIRRTIFKPWRFVLTLAAILRQGRNAQVLYVNGLYLEAIVANFFLRRPLVQKIVGDWAWEHARNKAWVRDDFEEFQIRRYSFRVELLRSLRRFSTLRADVLIVPSCYLARTVASWGVPEHKTMIIYNAVERPSSSHVTIPLSTRINAVTVGRLVSWKQVDHLIESFADCSDAGLVIVGDGPERGRLEELVRSRQLSERVYFAGQRSKEETFALMSACDIFVLNSTYEGFPHVVLEGMSAGLPVVATAAGGTPELVQDGENGVLISPHANGALSKTLTRLISSQTERKHLAVGANRKVGEFRSSVMVEKTEILLRKCANAHTAL